MAYKTVPLEKRIRENIKNYRLENLYNMEVFLEYFKSLSRILEAEILVTDRHGEKAVSFGNFAGFTPDVVGEPGRKIRVQNRTVGHVYVKGGNADPEAEKLLDWTVRLLGEYGQQAYEHREYAAYMDELEGRLGEENAASAGEREDVLTGVFNKPYFERRMKIIDRSEVAPVAVVNFNINDWKVVNDRYGDEESDRLIRVVAEFLKKEAKQDYVIGRTDGDVFNILIPMPEEDEAEAFCRRVGEDCEAFKDEKLAPSAAYGIVYKTNVEEKLADKLSDAEYEMFDKKFEMKNAQGYRERLGKSL